MKPCRKQNQSPAVQRPAAIPETNVRRYAHPIRTAKPASRTPAEEMLSYVREALSRQSEQLDEILRRLDSDKSETM